MKRLEICHTTRYGFGFPVQLGPHALLLRPREGHDLHIATSALTIAPNASLIWRRDCYDNVQGIATFDGESVTDLSIMSRLEVELYEFAPLNFLVEEHALHYPFSYTLEEQIALGPFLDPVYHDGQRLEGWLAPYRQVPPDTETFAILDGMNRRIHEELGYEVREEAGVMAPSDTLYRGRGSCRDMAALLMDSCRRLGIAARFVSGYVHGPATEAGGASTHAWAEVYLPGAGWKGFDPTNGAVVGPDHIPIAVHHHPEAVPPVAGVYTGPDGVGSTLSVDVQINLLA